MKAKFLKGICNITKLILQNWLEIIILIFTIWGVLIAKNSFKLQKMSEYHQDFPFFQYEYSNNFFKIIESGHIAITKVNWALPEKNADGSYSLIVINGLPTDLSFFEILDHYAIELGINTLINNYGKDLVECEFFRLAQDGIPALVSITYDQEEKQGLSSQDFILITRLDTKIPKIIVPNGGRNIKNPEQIKSMFDKYLLFLTSAIDEVNKMPKSDTNYKGQLRVGNECGLRVNQPINGY